MNTYLRSADEIRTHLPVPAPHHARQPAEERISDGPTLPDHSNPRIRAYLNSTGEIRVHPPVPVLQGEQEPRDTLLSLSARTQHGTTSPPSLPTAEIHKQ